MGNTPATQNPIATAINKALRASFDLSVIAAKTALVTVAPVFGAPVISQVTDFILNQLGNWFYIYFATGSTMLVISFQTAAERDSYLDAITRLQLANTNGDQNAKDKALQDAKDAMARLIHWNGSANA